MWGKVFGAFVGFVFGRWFGLFLGGYVGHLFDRRLGKSFDQQGGFGRYFSPGGIKARQAIFFHATFSVMGHVAKANGRVSEAHIQIATQLMNQLGLKNEQKREAQAAFREGKSSDFVLEKVLKDFKRSVFGRREVMQMFLEIQIQAAYADGSLSPAEQELLASVGKTLGFKRREIEAILARWEAEFRFHQQQHQSGGSSFKKPPTASELDDAYEILGVDKDSSKQDIKRAYKKLMTQNHPDKLVSKGLPPQMLEVAKRKAQDIQAAYDLINKRPV